MSTSDKLQRILDTKNEIRNAISEKGVEIDKDTLFSYYPDKIREIKSGGGYPIVFGTVDGEMSEFKFRVNYEEYTHENCTFENGRWTFISKDPIEEINFDYLENEYSIQHIHTLDLSNARGFKFANCKELNSISPSVLTSASKQFEKISEAFMNCQRLESINLSTPNYAYCNYMDNMFEGCSNLRDIYLLEWHYDRVSQLIEVSGLPNRDDNDGYIYTTIDSESDLETLNGMVPKGWTVLGKVANGPAVNPDQPSYVNPDFFELRTDGNTNYSYLFYKCNKTSLDLSNWDTSKVFDMSGTFSDCKALTSLDLSNWDTSNVTNFCCMFNRCNTLQSVKGINEWDTSNVTDVGQLFYFCEALTSLDLSNWDTSSVTNFTYTFSGCSSLTYLNISSWDVGSAKQLVYLCSSCDNLKDFYPPVNINKSINFSSSNKLSHDSLMRIINNLSTVSTTQKLNLGTTNLAKLTDDEKLIATQKGWALA